MVVSGAAVLGGAAVVVVARCSVVVVRSPGAVVVTLTVVEVEVTGDVVVTRTVVGVVVAEVVGGADVVGAEVVVPGAPAAVAPDVGRTAASAAQQAAAAAAAPIRIGATSQFGSGGRRGARTVWVSGGPTP